MCVRVCVRVCINVCVFVRQSNREGAGGMEREKDNTKADETGLKTSIS